MIGIGITSLQREHRRIWRCIQLYNSLHRQWSIDEIWRFIVYIFHMNNDSLIIGICRLTCKIKTIELDAIVIDEQTISKEQCTIKETNIALAKIVLTF